MIDQYGIHLGFLYIRFYGIILMSGVVAAAFISAWRTTARRQNPDDVWDMLTWLVVGGVIGARIWHILTPQPSMIEQGITPGYYLTHPLDAIAIWRGGLGIPGAVLGGALALYIYVRKKKLSFAVWVDIIAPGLAAAQAIGRWGNYVNQELYGMPTNLPWAIYISPQHRIADFASYDYYHPLFLYESLWNLFNAGLLLWIDRRYQERLKPGDIFLCYLVIYPVGRFLLEFLRVDASMVASINANQTLMAVIAITAAAVLVLRHKLPAAKVESTQGE